MSQVSEVSEVSSEVLRRQIEECKQNHNKLHEEHKLLQIETNIAAYDVEIVETNISTLREEVRGLQHLSRRYGLQLEEIKSLQADAANKLQWLEIEDTDTSTQRKQIVRIGKRISVPYNEEVIDVSDNE